VPQKNYNKYFLFEDVVLTVKSLIKATLPYGLVNHFVKKNNALRLLSETPSFDEPSLYNSNGQKIKTLFLSDERAKSWPYGFVTGRYPRYIFWDRNNYGLNNHVYSHERILKPLGKPARKFAFFIEGETIDPSSYTIFDKHPGLDKDYQCIFTHSAKFLDKYSNALFIPSGGVYYGAKAHGGKLNPEQYKLKSKNISIVSSNKELCDLHKFRIDIARRYKNSSLADTFGTFDGGSYIKIADSLEKYRYSIVVENDITPYRFTEKILNCFASMTVPIYIGATKIGDFFNLDGIIQISSPQIDGIDKAIADCNETDYIARLPAIMENYNRVADFLCIEDYIWNHYRDHFM
jgi:hypothetical protein